MAVRVQVDWGRLEERIEDVRRETGEGVPVSKR